MGHHLSVHLARLASQLLTRPVSSVLDVVTHLLAVQAQDPRGFRLAVRARSTGLAASDVDRALNEATVVVSWLNRGTLHLVGAEDYWWLQALTSPPRATGNAMRLRQEGVSPEAAERGVEVLLHALEDGPLRRAELRELVEAAGVPVAGQALVHLLSLATLRGHVVRGPVVDGEQAFVLVRDWLGNPPAPPERAVALAELARRYLAGHGPADERDLARWAGIGLGDARRGLAGVREAVPVAGRLLDLPGRQPLTAPPPPRLLGAFDPLLLGWSSRDDVTGPHTGLVTTNGLFRPFALVGGRAVARWRLAAGKVGIEALEPIAPQDLAALEADAADVRRFLAE